MIILLGLAGGALWGWATASRRGGNRFDKAQYAAVYGIIGALAGLFVSIGIERML